MSDKMTFHDTWEEFEKSYGFTDNEEVYTNGARLIPSFRVKQWLDHIAQSETKRQATGSSDLIEWKKDFKDFVDGLDIPRDDYKGIMAYIDEVPSAEPRKKREWIYGEKSGQDGWYCSECGGFIPWYYDFYGLDNIDFIEDFKTCPFCDSKMVSYTGADMKEGNSE